MAVTSVNAFDWEMPNADSTGERSYVVRYKVLTNDVNDGPITARDATGIPTVNSSFSIGNDFDNGAYATSYRCQLLEANASRKAWVVEVTYSTNPTKRNDENRENDPVDQPAIVSGGGVRFSRITEQDKDGNAIVNSVNDIITGVEMDDDRPSLRIQKNFATISLSTFLEFSNTVNSAEFFGLSARKWKLSFPRWERRYRGDNTGYYSVTFEFEGNTSTWDRPLYDRGHFYTDAQGNKFRFKANGIPLSAPQNLDGTGREQPAGLLPADAPNSPFQLYEEKDFSTLGIPTAL